MAWSKLGYMKLSAFDFVKRLLITIIIRKRQLSDEIYPLIRAVFGFSRIAVSADKCGFVLYQYLRQNPGEHVLKYFIVNGQTLDHRIWLSILPSFHNFLDINFHDLVLNRFKRVSHFRKGKITKCFGSWWQLACCETTLSGNDFNGTGIHILNRVVFWKGKG